MYFQIIFNTIVLGMLYALLAKSFEIIYRPTSLFLITHALALTIGAYALYFFSFILCLCFSISIIVALVMVLLIELCIYYFLYYSLMKKFVKNWEIMIASLGVYVFFTNIISISFGEQILSLGFIEQNIFSWEGNLFITNIQVITFFVSLIILFLLHLFLKNTIIGQKIKALSINSNASTVYGINNNSTSFWCLILGSTIAFFAGILISIDVGINSSIGFDWLFPGIVVMIIGGIGRNRYCIIGAMFLAFAQQLSSYFIDSKWMNATAYLVLIFFLLFRPFGFSGKKLKKTEV